MKDRNYCSSHDLIISYRDIGTMVSKYAGDERKATQIKYDFARNRCWESIFCYTSYFGYVVNYSATIEEDRVQEVFRTVWRCVIFCACAMYFSGIIILIVFDWYTIMKYYDGIVRTIASHWAKRSAYVSTLKGMKELVTNFLGSMFGDGAR